MTALKQWHCRVVGLPDSHFHSDEDAKVVAEMVWHLHCNEYCNYESGRVTLWADDQPRRTFIVMVAMKPIYSAVEVEEETT